MKRMVNVASWHRVVLDGGSPNHHLLILIPIPHYAEEAGSPRELPFV